MIVVVRIVLGILYAAAAAVAAVPMVVLLDLAGGGTGWGLCPEGLAGCHVGWLAGPELLLWLMAALFVLVGLIAAGHRALAALHRRAAATGRRGRVTTPR